MRIYSSSGLAVTPPFISVGESEALFGAAASAVVAVVKGYAFSHVKVISPRRGDFLPEMTGYLGRHFDGCHGYATESIVAVQLASALVCMPRSGADGEPRVIFRTLFAPPSTMVETAKQLVVPVLLEHASIAARLIRLISKQGTATEDEVKALLGN